MFPDNGWFPSSQRDAVLMADATGAAARALGAAGSYRESQYDQFGYGAGVVPCAGYDQLALRPRYGGNAPVSQEFYVSFSNDLTNWSPEVASDEVAGAVSHPYIVRTPPLDASRPDVAADAGPQIFVDIADGARFLKIRWKHTGGDGTQTVFAPGTLSLKR